MRSSPPSGVTPASTTMTDDGSSEAVDGVSGDVGHCRPAGTTRIRYTVRIPYFYTTNRTSRDAIGGPAVWSFVARGRSYMGQ